MNLGNNTGYRIAEILFKLECQVAEFKRNCVTTVEKHILSRHRQTLDGTSHHQFNEAPAVHVHS